MKKILGGIVLALLSSPLMAHNAIPGTHWITVNQTGALTNGSVELVEDPKNPGPGKGSVKFTVTSDTDKAEIRNTDDFPEGLGPYLLNGLTGTFSTYVPDGGLASHVPALKFIGYRNAGKDSADLTTLNVEISYQSGFAAGSWQDWTIGPATPVWDTLTRTTDPTASCSQNKPCSLSEYNALHPDAHFTTMSLALGSGVQGGPATGYLRAVQVSPKGKALFWPFQLPPAQVPANASWAIGLLALLTGFMALFFARRRLAMGSK